MDQFRNEKGAVILFKGLGAGELAHSAKYGLADLREVALIGGGEHSGKAIIAEYLAIGSGAFGNALDAAHDA